MYHHWEHYTPGYDVAVEGVFAGLFVMIGIFVLIALIVCLLKVIGTWRILSKANQPGWGAIIPFYNTYLLCKISGVNPWWIVICLFSSILNAIPIIGTLACGAISIYFMILLNVSLARSFKKDDSFAIGLILLAPIFYLILGCGNSEYEGENPMEDFVLNQFNSSNNNNQNKNTTKSSSNSKEDNKEVSYCSNCGSKIDEFTRFCPNCGNEIK